MAGETKMPFGKFGPGYGDQRTIEGTPSDYLRYLLEEEDNSGWVSTRYGTQFLDEIESVLAARDRGDSHWNEKDEEAGAEDFEFLRK